jgi:hypothetical protein
MASFFGFGSGNAQEKKEFKEPLNTAVFTTKFVTEDKKTITYVTHDADDGAWQFFSDDEFEDLEKVAKIIGLGQIIEIDHTLTELADMPVGHCATRKNKPDKWEIFKHE